ncbi:MAG TPA: CHASE2 domain-containing protein, partial [bacterium]|nr:CHASE2 domain-containing protein [bacterium]
MTPLAYLKSPALRVAALAALVVLLVGYLSPLGVPLEERAYDERLRFRHDRGWPDDLVLVAIDDATTAREGMWPWPRGKTRALVDRLTQLGAKTIAMDIIYQAPTNETDDRGLAASLSHTFVGVGFAVAGAEPRPEVLRRAMLRGPIVTPKENLLREDQLALPID